MERVGAGLDLTRSPEHRLTEPAWDDPDSRVELSQVEPSRVKLTEEGEEKMERWTGGLVFVHDRSTTVGSVVVQEQGELSRIACTEY